MGTTLKPADLRSEPIEAATIPFPNPEITPPEIKIYLCTTNNIKKKSVLQD